MKTVAFILKGYPRLSETFIAQEILSLERLGLAIEVVSLRYPADVATHPIQREIGAPVTYLPEYLYREPLRVLRAFAAVGHHRRFRAVLATWWRDFVRDPTPNRIRRFGQAVVLAHELPARVGRLHAHFLHTPASVARYASILTGLGWSLSAHAKDIWTAPAWEKREKLAECDWAVVCTEAGFRHLQGLAPPGRLHLVYHGLDLDRFPPPPSRASDRDGSDPDHPVVLMSVCRAVEKKGLDTLIEALARLPAHIAWRLVHIGGGPRLDRLRSKAARSGLADRIQWLGPQSQEVVLENYGLADLFVLPSIVARDGDRDGLPNVLLEAQSQGLACISGNLPGIAELISDGTTGVLIEPGDNVALAGAISRLARDPRHRQRLGAAALKRVHERFASTGHVGRLASLFGLSPVNEENTPCGSRFTHP